MSREDIRPVPEPDRPPVPATPTVALVVPAQAVTDARQRALRTFVQGLIIDLVLVMALWLTTVVADPTFAWSWPFWVVQFGLLGKSVLMAVASYVMRRVAPPKSSTRP